MQSMRKEQQQTEEYEPMHVKISAADLIIEVVVNDAESKKCTFRNFNLRKMEQLLMEEGKEEKKKLDGCSSKTRRRCSRS
jgi:hypothetical protein